MSADVLVVSSAWNFPGLGLPVLVSTTPPAAGTSTRPGPTSQKQPIASKLIHTTVLTNQTTLLWGKTPVEGLAAYSLSEPCHMS